MLDPAPLPRIFVEHRGEEPPGVVDRGPACPAEVGIAPAAFFRDTLLIRLPPDVEPEQVPQQSPSFARSSSPLAMGCAADLSAAVFIKRESQLGGDTLARARSRLFTDLNFPPGAAVRVVDGSDEAHDVSMTIGFPGHGVWGETQVYVRMFDLYDHVHVVGFIAEQSSFHQLEPIFAASARTMLALPD